MDIDLKGMGKDAIYKLLVGAVVPRPIAWVTTLNDAGKVNAAPFSCYTFVSSQPPLVAVSMGRVRGGAKDSSRNAVARGEFVVNVAQSSQAKELHLSSTEHPPEVSETELLGIATAPSIKVSTPRIAEAPVAMECRYVQTIEFGELRAQLVIGEVLHMHVRDDLYRDGKIDSVALDPLGRLGGPRYATLGEILTLPSVEVSPSA